MHGPLFIAGHPRRAVFSIGLLFGFTSVGLSAPLEAELNGLLGSLRPAVLPQVTAAANRGTAPPSGPPQVSFADDGFVRHVSAPFGHDFAPENADPVRPELAAWQFLNRHARLLGITSPATEFRVLKVKERNERRYVRFQQVYGGFPVFAAQITVQLNAQGGMEGMNSDIERQTQALDDKRISLIALLTPEQAAERAKTLLVPEANGGALETTPPQSMLFSPSVVGEQGEPRLVWDIVVSNPGLPPFRDHVLLDSRTGELAFRYPLIHTALKRTVYDYSQGIRVTNNGAVTTTWKPIRSEGGPPVTESQVNQAYDYLGATYAFYLNQHSRTNWYPFNPEVQGWVRYCPSESQCPWSNADYDSLTRQLHFGDAQLADDVVAHEYTHGITAFESGLLYRNASGAINESLSDIWGEFVDLTYPAGNDSPAVRWLCSEDTPDGPIRNMKNPPQFNHPDRLGSPWYIPPPAQPSLNNDYGGVHSNSGVLNKLCYLLTDGDYFNGYSITGLGIPRVAALFYEVNANLLQSAADWGDLYDALRQAALNLAWSKVEQENLCRACLAVEIALRPRSQYVDKGSAACLVHNGSQSCGLLSGPHLTLSQGVNNICPGDILWIRTGSYNERPTVARTMTLRPYDGPVTIGR